MGPLPKPLERCAEDVRSASGAVLLFDENDRIVAASDSCSVVFERVVDDLVGQTLEDLIDDGYLHPAIREKHRYATDELRANDVEDRQETFRATVNPAAEDDQHVYGVRIEPVGSGDPVGTRWALSDIATSQHYEQSIDALHAATRDLMDASDELEVFDVVGQAANDALGFPGIGVRSYDPSEEVLRHVAFGSVVEEIDARPPFPVRDSPHGTAFRRGETIVESPPDTDDAYGREAFTQVMYVPIGEEGVLSVGTIGTDFENSDRRFAEILAENAAAALEQVHQRKRLREQRDELERQNERLDAFGSILSHDLRNPLTLAKGSLERVRTTGDESALDDVGYALDRIEDIIDDVLALAREGTEVEDTHLVSLESVARTAWETVETRGVSLSLTTGMRVEADPDRLQRALENLFRNTIEHATTPAGAPGDDGESNGEDATIVRIGALDDRTGFFVEDDGSGIEPDERDRVFERGYSTAREGTGLGLVIVRELVQAHGWSVQVADGTDGGARFEVSGVSTGSEE